MAGILFYGEVKLQNYQRGRERGIMKNHSRNHAEKPRLNLTEAIYGYQN